ncbi:MAG TPA: dihydrolipoamide acetyltransferase family protein [Conexibacter sp.]|jgi:2-oxoglutarate dehydrogenase E2 component (dihydrolipoamide succinyltransferase)|nr:dihydrolipoamide acetyltransferase family protein [Conexibacter sp.]
MPQLGVSVVEGTIVKWLVAVGDEVAADDPLCEIDTDKIVTEIPSPATGTLTEILVTEGETVEVGTILARIGTSVLPETGQTGAGQDTAGDREPSAAATPSPSMPVAQGAYLSPVVQRLAAERGVDLSSVVGTGTGARVRKQDVLAAIERPLHIESPYRPDDEPEPTGQLSRMRRTIGAHMKRSLDTAATCTTWMEADMSHVESARRHAKASSLLGVTALPIVAHCAIDALKEHPALNATLEGERYTRHEAVHLGVAVSLGEEGLIVPVIRDAHTLTVEQLGLAIRDLARRARAQQLTPDEVHGGTFTVTNPGQFGSLMATPVINQPQVAILDLEAIVKRPIVVTDDAGDDMIEIRPQTILGLSWDHRALDGAQAAQYLGALRRRLERWDG